MLCTRNGNNVDFHMKSAHQTAMRAASQDSALSSEKPLNIDCRFLPGGDY
jgi:hypothetical protein